MLKRDRKLAFDIVIPTEHGAFYCACFKRKKEVHLVMLGENTKMAIAKAHALLGHGNESSTRETANLPGLDNQSWGIYAMQKLCHCEDPIKNVPKESGGEKSKKANDPWLHEIVTVKAPKGEGIKVN